MELNVILEKKSLNTKKMKIFFKKNFRFQIYSHWKRLIDGDFPGGAVVKNPPTNAGDTGSSPGPERSHMPRSN